MALGNPQDTTDHGLVRASNLDQLWETEFGDRRELALRSFGISVGGISLLVYSGSCIGLLWMAVYFGSLLCTYFFLLPRADRLPRTTVLSYGAFFVSVCSYLALPIYVMIVGDDLMVFGGAMALLAYAVFSLFRPTPPGILRHLDVAAAWVIAVVVAYVFFPIATSLFPQLLIVFWCLVMGAYFTMSIRNNRAAKQELQLAGERSIEAQKMEAIGRLSGGIAHDFNNILTVLQGNLELYHEVPEGPERDALVVEARAAGVRASALVAQLLAFARRATLETRAHDAKPMVEELCTLARRLLPATIQLDSQLPDTPACVFADANRLHSALLNLILNANDAMEGRGSIILEVEMLSGPAHLKTSRAGTEEHIRFSVTDDGPGMTPEVEKHALEPFFTTKPVGKGSGLGLSMALGFAQQSGGALKLSTGPTGTTVALHLPICAETQNKALQDQH